MSDHQFYQSKGYFYHRSKIGIPICIQQLVFPCSYPILTIIKVYKVYNILCMSTFVPHRWKHQAYYATSL